MKNFYLRLISSLVIGPAFLLCLYEVGFFFYSLLFLLLLSSFYEIFKNVKQVKLRFFLYSLIILFIYALINLRGIYFYNYIVCIWIIIIVWTTDIGGYFFGKLFKGPKLSSYSPNKTISGLIGSIFLSQFSFIIPLYFLNNFLFNLKFFFIQFLLCIVSVLGDIFFSYVKRINYIKDYSNFIPGHGGILDRIDGMIFAIIFYYFINLINGI